MITLDHVSKIYSMGDQELRALDDVSLRIDDGEFVAIIGASGSGKSTLMNVLGCLDTPTSGRYLIDGISVEALSGDDKAICATGRSDSSSSTSTSCLASRPSSRSSCL